MRASSRSSNSAALGSASASAPTAASPSSSRRQKHGVELRRTLGAWPQLTLAAARKAVEALIGRMAAGFDVNQEHRDRIAKAKAPKPATLAELVDRWEREGWRSNATATGSALSPRSATRSGR